VKELLSKYNVADPLIFVKDNELYISLSFNVPTPLPDNDDVLGVDRGIRRLIATSDGMIIKGSEYQKHKRRIRYNKKQLQSKGTKSARRRLKRQRRKERNFSNNYCHLVVNEVLKTDKGIIVLENLKGIKEKTKKHNNGYKRKEHNRRFSQIPLYKLEEILTYKAQHLGKKVETVSPKDTSKNDCRGLKNGKRVGCRYITVDNKQMDSDVNAAVNIGNKYLKHPILTYPDRIVPVGRLIVTEPIACQTPSGALQATNSLG
jgi:IS605 OrfB family transposase